MNQRQGQRPQPLQAKPSRMSTSRGHAGRTSQPGAGELASAAETLAGLTAAALGGGLDGTAALTSLTAARLLAAELERSELAFIEAARDGGATWSQIAAAMGTRNRQSAQKRHADLTRRRPRPPIADTRPRAPEKDEAPAETWPLPPAEATASREDDRRTLATPAAPGAADGSGRRQRQAAGHPEDHAPDHRRRPLQDRKGTRPRRDPRLARARRRQTRGHGPPHLARRAKPTRMGRNRQRRHGNPRDRNRQGHHRRQRPHPGRRRRQPPPHAATAAGKRARERRAMNMSTTGGQQRPRGTRTPVR